MFSSLTIMPLKDSSKCHTKSILIIANGLSSKEWYSICQSLWMFLPTRVHGIAHYARLLRQYYFIMIDNFQWTVVAAALDFFVVIMKRNGKTQTEPGNDPTNSGPTTICRAVLLLCFSIYGVRATCSSSSSKFKVVWQYEEQRQETNKWRRLDNSTSRLCNSSLSLADSLYVIPVSHHQIFVAHAQINLGSTTRPIRLSASRRVPHQLACHLKFESESVL